MRRKTGWIQGFKHIKSVFGWIKAGKKHIQVNIENFGRNPLEILKKRLSCSYTGQIVTFSLWFEQDPVESHRKHQIVDLGRSKLGANKQDPNTIRWVGSDLDHLQNRIQNHTASHQDRLLWPSLLIRLFSFSQKNYSFTLAVPYASRLVTQVDIPTSV